jgi:CDP-diacylglycerol---glycerol-3-phosphate 3-phosphatidyltransferase
VLNELGDVVSDLFIYFPLLKHEFFSLHLVVVFLCLSVVNEFAGLLAKVTGGQRRYDGPMGKSDRAFLIGLYGLLCFFGWRVSQYMPYIFIAINSLLLVSTWLRVKRSLRHE